MPTSCLGSRRSIQIELVVSNFNEARLQQTAAEGGFLGSLRVGLDSEDIKRATDPAQGVTGLQVLRAYAGEDGSAVLE